MFIPLNTTVLFVTTLESTSRQTAGLLIRCVRLCSEQAPYLRACSAAILVGSYGRGYSNSTAISNRPGRINRLLLIVLTLLTLSQP